MQKTKHKENISTVEIGFVQKPFGEQKKKKKRKRAKIEDLETVRTIRLEQKLWSKLR